MKRKFIWVGSSLLILLVLMGLPFLVPMAQYQQQAETLLTSQLGRPVHIGSLRVALLPTPRLHAGNISVGEHAEIQIQGLTITPTISSLLTEQKHIAQVRVDSPKLKQAGLDWLIALASSPPKQDAASSVSVRHIVLSNANIEWGGAPIPIFDVALELGDNNQPTGATINSVDGKLKLEAAPQNDALHIALKASDWVLPVGLPVRFDKLNSEMQLQGSNLQINTLKGRLLGGSVDWHGSVNWQKGWRLQGQFKLNDLSIKQLFSALGKSAPLTGQLSANGSVQSRAKTGAELANQIAIDSQFKIENGVLHGVDLLNIANLLLKGKIGGETKFDTFTGNAQMRGKQYRLNHLNVQSNLLAATGHISVAPNKSLGGELKVEVKNSANLVAIPLNVSGTLDKPMVLPTKSALIGGAIGTAVLPGAGTAAGIQAADKAEKVLKGLFGR